MTQQQPHIIAGFNPFVLMLIRQAKRLNVFSIYLIYLAIFAFLFFGTLKSLPQFKDSYIIYLCFHYLPYGFVGLSIPLTLYVAFILFRYRLSQPSMLLLCILVGFGLFLVSGYIALVAWIGVAFLFKANIKRFFNFIEENSKSSSEK